MLVYSVTVSSEIVINLVYNRNYFSS